MLTRHELAADVGIEPTSYALTARCIALMLIRKNKWSGMRVSNPSWRGWKPRAQPLGQTRSTRPELLNNSGDWFRGGGAVLYRLVFGPGVHRGHAVVRSLGYQVADKSLPTRIAGVRDNLYV